MANWNRYLAKVAHTVERAIDKTKGPLEGRLRRDPLVVFPYLTYGTRDRVFIKGRVLEDKGIERAREDASVWDNLKAAFHRFESDEAPGAEIRVGVGGAERVVTADKEGYFDLWLELPEPLPDRLEHDTRFELISPHPVKQSQLRFEGEVVTPPDDAAFGVISDVDDTVLVSDATSTLALAKKVLFGNARTRLPFEGVAAFYRALQGENNPVFYVSSSPWNLYDVLVEFMELNDIPLGPLMLRDWGITPRELLPTSHGDHKHAAIEGILGTYPELPFVLIGDSGQEDPEIYREVVERHPGQIRAIYIRDVGVGENRHAEVERIVADLEERGVPMLLVPDTAAAAEHAAAQGWIPAAAVDEVRAARDADHGET